MEVPFLISSTGQQPAGTTTQTVALKGMYSVQCPANCFAFGGIALLSVSISLEFMLLKSNNTVLCSPPYAAYWLLSQRITRMLK